MHLVARVQRSEMVRHATTQRRVIVVPRFPSCSSRLLIAGGQERSQVIDDSLTVALQSRCRCIVLTGETGKSWQSALQSQWHSEARERPSDRAGRAVHIDKLENAVRSVRELAQEGDVVLFAPGAPSFDRYDNFACRGDHFRSIVMGL